MNERCPKCDAPRATKACPQCGVVSPQSPPQMELDAVPESLQQLWENVEKNWDDTPSHALFMEQALRHGKAGYAASRYRSKNDAMARQQLEKLTQRLILSLHADATPPKESPGAMRNILYVLLFVVIGILVFLIFAQSIK